MIDINDIKSDRLTDFEKYIFETYTYEEYDGIIYFYLDDFSTLSMIYDTSSKTLYVENFLTVDYKDLKNNLIRFFQKNIIYDIINVKIKAIKYITHGNGYGYFGNNNDKTTSIAFVWI